MKHIAFAILLATTLFQLSAQNGVTLTEGKAVLIYALPKTELNIEITLETTKQTPGIFYQYSERYLATNKVITEEKTICKLKNIQITPQAVADPKRTFTITPLKSSVLNNLSVNAQGIICGINVAQEFNKTVEKKVFKQINTENPKKNDLLPLGEEFMMAGSAAKLAEGAAKQIYRIRESRLSLLTGDLEHLPSDGKSMDAMLKGMDALEKQLTELFIGKTTTETQTKTITLSPDSIINKKIIFRLSAFNGIVDQDDLSGRPYYLSIEPAKIDIQKSADKEKTAKTELFTVLPISAKVSISDGVNVVYSGIFDIPQLGALIPMSQEIINNPKVQIKIDPKSGRLISIQ